MVQLSNSSAALDADSDDERVDLAVSDTARDAWQQYGMSVCPPTIDCKSLMPRWDWMKASMRSGNGRITAPRPVSCRIRVVHAVDIRLVRSW